jgi:replicative DNA helicase
VGAEAVAETNPLVDERAEADVVGSLLLADGQLVDEILAVVDPGDLWRGVHRTVTEAVVELRRDGYPTDPTAVARRLADRGDLDNAGGHAYLADVAHQVPSPANGAFHARVVADLARRRHVQLQATRLAHEVTDRECDVDALVADAADAMTTLRRADGVLDDDELTRDALAELARGDAPIGWPAPWSPLAIVMRIVPGWLHLLHGHRSAGKSALLDSLAVELGERHGLAVAVWSPESAPAARHKALLAAIRATTPMSELAGDTASDALAWCSTHVTHLDHHHVQRLDAILAQASALRARGRCDVLIIDPWTRVDMWADAGRGEGWDRMLQRQLTRAVAWARSSGVAVIVGAHPRNVEHNADARPPRLKPSDLHGGVMYANCADAIWHVWRDHTDLSQTGRIAEVHVQKVKEEPAGGRMGVSESLYRHASGRYQPVSDRAESHPPAAQTEPF